MDHDLLVVHLYLLGYLITFVPLGAINFTLKSLFILSSYAFAVASSATSTYKNNYSINLHLANAPTGTIVTNLDNEQLVSWTASGKTYWTVPTPDHTLTNMNENGSEYAGDFKVCIPARNTPKSGNITFQANATITQLNIYFANRKSFSW